MEQFSDGTMEGWRDGTSSRKQLRDGICPLTPCLVTCRLIACRLMSPPTYVIAVCGQNMCSMLVPPTSIPYHTVAWYGMVWYGMVWYGMVWYGMVWYGMVWYGMVWYGMVWYSMVWQDSWSDAMGPGGRVTLLMRDNQCNTRVSPAGATHTGVVPNVGKQRYFIFPLVSNFVMKKMKSIEETHCVLLN